MTKYKKTTENLRAREKEKKKKLMFSITSNKNDISVCSENLKTVTDPYLVVTTFKYAYSICCDSFNESEKDGIKSALNKGGEQKKDENGRL